MLVCIAILDGTESDWSSWAGLHPCIFGPGPSSLPTEKATLLLIRIDG